MRFLIAIILVIGQIDLHAQKNALTGSYRFFQESASRGEGHSSATWDLTLNTDSTFYIEFSMDLWDVWVYDTSSGIYKVNGDVLTLYSEIPKKTNIVNEVRDEVVPDSLFKISIVAYAMSWDQLRNDIGRYHFYSMNSKYERHRITPLYTIPDSKTEIKSQVKLLSFVFKRDSIDQFLYCDQFTKDITTRQGSFLINLNEFRYNNYAIDPQAAKGTSTTSGKFVDVSTYRFEIKGRSLVAKDGLQYTVGGGKPVAVKLVKGRGN